MHSANGIHRFDVTTLTTEEILPAIQLKSAVMVLKPSESKITALSSRDTLPPGRQIYQNLLTYNLHLSKNQEVALHTPLLSDVLYESEFESQFWMLFDANKMLVGCGDAYSNATFMKLDKGDYTVRLQIRHEKREFLEKVSEVVMQATFKLATPIVLDAYLSHKNAILNGKKATAVKLARDNVLTLFVAPLSNEKYFPTLIFCIYLL